jgi:hypothetical protein
MLMNGFIITPSLYSAWRCWMDSEDAGKEEILDALNKAEEEYAWGLPYFNEQKYLQKFVSDAYREKVKRSEANDKVAKQRVLASNISLLEPLIKEMYTQGKLEYLYEHGRNDGGDNGKTGKT